LTLTSSSVRGNLEVKAKRLKALFISPLIFLDYRPCCQRNTTNRKPAISGGLKVILNPLFLASVALLESGPIRVKVVLSLNSDFPELESLFFFHVLQACQKLAIDE